MNREQATSGCNTYQFSVYFSGLWLFFSHILVAQFLSNFHGGVKRSKSGTIAIVQIYGPDCKSWIIGHSVKCRTDLLVSSPPNTLKYSPKKFFSALGREMEAVQTERVRTGNLWLTAGSESTEESIMKTVLLDSKSARQYIFSLQLPLLSLLINTRITTSHDGELLAGYCCF